MTMNMIIPILVHCSFFLDFEVYNAIRTYFNAYTSSFTKTAKQLWIRSLHKGPFGQAIQKSAWATGFSHTSTWNPKQQFSIDVWLFPTISM